METLLLWIKPFETLDILPVEFVVTLLQWERRVRGLSWQPSPDTQLGALRMDRRSVQRVRRAYPLPITACRWHTSCSGGLQQS